jgi:hypothetical protein
MSPPDDFRAIRLRLFKSFSILQWIMTSRSELLLVITVAFHALHDGLLKNVDMAQRDSLRFT